MTRPVDREFARKGGIGIKALFPPLPSSGANRSKHRQTWSLHHVESGGNRVLPRGKTRFDHLARFLIVSAGCRRVLYSNPDVGRLAGAPLAALLKARQSAPSSPNGRDGGLRAERHSAAGATVVVQEPDPCDDLEALAADPRECLNMWPDRPRCRTRRRW
jgi:hypothetical protein